jgi:hypothetical protein
MTAHPDASPEAVDAPAENSNPVADFEKYLDEIDENKDEEAPAPSDDESEDADADPDEGDAEADDDTDDEDEPEAPAIDPPVSLTKEQKAAFAQLPPDLQKVWAETEAQRNREVQARTTEAAEAKRNAQADAQRELAAIQKQYADELAEYAKVFEPQEPDYSLIATDPQAFAEQVAMQKQMAAHRDYLAKQSAEARLQAEQNQQAILAQQHAQELQILRRELPEMNDPEKGPKLMAELGNIGRELGYDDDTLKLASASDVLALKKASDWKSKAAKYDAWQAHRMEAVRNAKGKPKVMKPNGAETRAEQGPRRTEAAWQRAKQTRSADDFADYLSKAGIL